MSEAFSGHRGYGSPDATRDDQERLANLKRAIDTIERRVAGATPPPSVPQPPYASAPTGSSGPSLADLQSQINRLSGQIPSAPPPAPAPQGGSNMQAAIAEIAARQSMLNAPKAPSPAAPAATAPQADEATYKGIEAIGRHLGDLKRELAGLKQKVMQPEPIRVPQAEIDRIAQAIGNLRQTDSFDEEAFQRLTGEIEALRAVVTQDVKHTVRSELAGTKEIEEQRLISVNKRLEELSKGLDVIGRHTLSNDVSPQVDNLANQLDAMRSTIDELPQKLAVDRLEQRLGEVAEKLEYTMLAVAESIPSPDQAAVGPENIETIERRLDEISRALVAVSNAGSQAPEIDLSSIERVEARMADLARGLDVVINDTSRSTAAPELDQLSSRIDGLSEQISSFSGSQAPEIDLSSVERVEAHMADLARGMDAILKDTERSSATPEFGQLNDRIATLSDQIAAFETQAKSGDLGAAPAMMAASDISIIEEQLRKLNDRFEHTAGEAQTGNLEQQIERLHVRIEEAANVNSTAAQMSNLEAQIGQILRQINRQEPGQIAVDLAPMEERLGQIENYIVNAQSFSLEAAQQAAQQAVAMMGPQSEQGLIVSALSEDLKALQNIAEHGSARNAESVLAVQETLAQVVDRLASIEGSIDEGLPAQNIAAPMQAAQSAPVAQPTQPPHRLEEVMHEQAAPVQPAMNAAGYAPANDADLYGAAGSVTAPPLDPAAHMEASMPPAAGYEDNTPLEPGSQIPNLDQLVQNTNAEIDQRQQAVHAASITPPTRNSQASVVEAARRAVKHAENEIAAAQESEAKAAKPAGDGLKGKLQGLTSGSGFDLQKFRKPLVLAAAAVLLAIIGFKGYQMLTPGKVEPKQIEASTGAGQTQPALGQEEFSGNATLSESTVLGENSQFAEESVTVREITDDGALQPELVTEEQPETIQDAMEKVAEADATDQTLVPSGEVVAADAAAPERVEVAKADERLEENTPPTVVAPATFDVPENAGTAALVAAAESGDPKALFQLGMRYSEGNGVKRDMAASAEWFSRAAELGFAPAQYSIGSLHEKGIGVERDVDRAAGFYEQAAMQGNARAMHNLAVIAATGNPSGASPDMDKAVKWFTDAANFGIKDSQFNLGILYGQGLGVPQNLSESYKWFALAAKTGDSDAASKRDEVANAMDPDDLALARKEVAGWQVQKLDESANRFEAPEEWRGSAAKKAPASAALTQEQLVQKAQAMLNERGFDVGTPDGLIGPQTRQAISEFQRSAGIPVTGKVDKNLLKALDIQV